MIALEIVIFCLSGIGREMAFNNSIGDCHFLFVSVCQGLGGK